MSTASITVFKSCEMDGKTVQEVACLWRRFDGYPTSHAAELQQIIGRNDLRFICLTEMLAWMLERILHACPDGHKWQFAMVNRTEHDLFPCYIYEIWLEFKPRWYPRSKRRNGIPYIAAYLPRELGKCEVGKCFYRGPVSELDPRCLEDQMNHYQEIEHQRNVELPRKTEAEGQG